MLRRLLALSLLCVLIAACRTAPMCTPAPIANGIAEPLSIGETFTITSSTMGEVRRINVYIPTIYGEPIDAALPALYMPDGGINEDFLHVAGLVQVLVGNGGMRPFILVGIENTVRRRDLSGPTTNTEDLKMAPVVGGSATFRRFIRDELMPVIRTRYRTTDESAIIGESLAGLFVLETFFLEPDLFNTYIAFDPSIWWADEGLVASADTRLATPPSHPTAIFIANSGEPSMRHLTDRLAASFKAYPSPFLTFHYTPLPAETHATIYHPAALLALRTLFAPPPAE